MLSYILLLVCMVHHFDEQLYDRLSLDIILATRFESRRTMAAGSTFGQLNEFRPGRERLSVYLERFELYISVNSVAEEKKVPLFLTVIGNGV